MTEFTQSLEKWLTLYHSELITPLTFGHLEEFTPELKREYLAWCQTNGGRKYLEDGSEYNKKQHIRSRRKTRLSLYVRYKVRKILSRLLVHG